MNEFFAFVTAPTFGFVLKLVAGCAAAGFGILGIGAKTRDDAGRLTRQGKIALIGVLVSALIGAASGVYDFVTGRNNADKERLRAELLLRSVQRSIYPFRDFTISAVLPLNQKFDGIKEYKERLRRGLLEDRTCKDSKRCSFSGDVQDPDNYFIPLRSPLFPAKTSAVYVVANNMQVGFNLLKAPAIAGTGGSPRYKVVGDLLIDWHNNFPAGTTIDYQFKTGSLSLDIRDAPPQPQRVASGGVYSLVDFVPGMIAAYADAYDDGVCEDMHMDTSTCKRSVVDPLFETLSVTSVQIHFPYPKSIDIDSYYSGTTCENAVHPFLVQRLPFDIEEADSLGGFGKRRASGEDADLCKDYKNAEPRQIK